MADARPLSIPAILGTTRKGRMSARVAQFVTAQLEAWEGVDTELIDITAVPMPVDDAGDAIKNPDFSAKMHRADALAIVVPEYNHSFPGLLAPPLGMLVGAEVYLRLYGIGSVFCAKLNHVTNRRCIFKCGYALCPSTLHEAT